MTEKRFILKYIEEQHLSANLYDDKTFIGSIGIGAELIVELLNDLSEENEQLKKDKTNLHRAMSRDRVRYLNENEQLKEDNMLLIEDSEKYRKLSIQFDNRNKELISENEQLKTTISRLIEQNRKNNDLLVSDIRLLEKALWCPNCTRNIKRLKELKKEFEND